MKGAIKRIIDNWDENETIMNLAQEVKRLQQENGILTSYLAELEYKDSIKNYNKLEKELKKARAKQGVYRAKLGQLITKQEIDSLWTNQAETTKKKAIIQQ